MSISIEEAVEKILAHVTPIQETEVVDLSQAAGRILAEDVIASFNNPPFDRTPVDGYACHYEDTLGASREHPAILQVVREIDAGDYWDGKVYPGQAVRIMTGAAVPEGCDCCIYQEVTNYGEDQVEIYKEHKKYQNYCFAGEDFKKGDRLLEKGMKLTFVEAAVLAGMGRTEVSVLRKPKIAVFTTGDEVTDPGKKLLPGKIYNSNQTLAVARLQALGIQPVIIETVKDDVAVMAKALKAAADKADLIITTGGVSVGKKDILHGAVDLIKAERIFWGVAMKPGMPTLFTVSGGTPIISLSGNPFGVAATMEYLIRPALAKLAQNERIAPVRVKGVMADTLSKSIRGRRIVRAAYRDGKFYLPKGLHSNGVISSMAGCNCLIDAHGEAGDLVEGKEVEAILL